MGLMRLFFQVNSTLNVIVFADEFETRMKELRTENVRLRTEMMQTDRYREVSKLIDKRGRKAAQSARSSRGSVPIGLRPNFGPFISKVQR